MRTARSLLLATALAVLAGCAVDADVTASRSDALEQAHGHAADDAPPPPGASSRLTAGAFGFATLDVGQGDAAVVVAPRGCVALLDAGPTGAGVTIKRYLHSLGVTRIDFAVVSHYHEDHLGGLDEVERGGDAIPITTVYDHGGSYSSTAYSQYDARFRGRRRAVSAGESMTLCDDVDFAVVAANANGEATSDENARSVTVKVSYGALDLLVGGDLTSGVESDIGSAIGPIEIYKVHHHGSAGSSSAQFLDRSRPTVSLISVAANNSYGHPTRSTLSRLGEVGSAVWQTAGTAATRGHLEVVSTDGQSFTVRKNAASATYPSKPE